MHPLERREHWPQKASCTLWREGNVGHKSFLVKLVVIKLVWFKIEFVQVKLDRYGVVRRYVGQGLYRGLFGDMSVKDSIRGC